MSSRGTRRAAPMLADWRKQAACRGLGALFDPPEDLPETEYDDRIAEARQICRNNCPVLNDCGQWVLSLRPQDDPGGCVAGLTVRQRMHYRKPFQQAQGAQ